MTTARHTAETTLRDYKARLLRVLVHIQQHLDAPLALEELAAVACFSPYHFHRVFTGLIGESVKGHIRRLRLERAAIQLKLSGYPVTRIAFDAGYETHEAFTRAFKSAFGLAPTRFRTQRNAVVRVTAPSGVHYQRQDPSGNPPLRPSQEGNARSALQRKVPSWEGQGAGSLSQFAINQSGKLLKNFKTKRTGGRKMNVTIKTVEPMRVAFMRHIGPYHEVGAIWDTLLPTLGKEGLIGGDAVFLGVCHDDPDVTPPEKLRYDACVNVDEDFAPSGEVGVQTIPGGEYAVTTHFGSYQKLGETYAKLFADWLPRSGRELGSTPCFDIYLNDPGSTEPEDLLTDVYVPLQDASPLS